MTTQIKLADSLVACGFNVFDMEELQTLVSASAEINDGNLAAMEPFQTKFSSLMIKLPHVEVEDADGNVKLKLDQSSDAFKDFMGVAKDAAMDRLRLSQRYVLTFAKVPTPTGALMWADISTLKDVDGNPADIDPTKFRHYTTSGSLIDPRQRLKVDDPDLMEQVINPLRKKFKQSATTAISRLKTRARSGGKNETDVGKKHKKIAEALKALYKYCKQEEFDVGTEKALNHVIAQAAKVCGIEA